MENLKNEIAEIVSKRLGDKFVYEVSKIKGAFGGEYIKIWIACSNVNINNVSGQKPQIVSLCLDLETLNLEPQSFGGNGGRCIYREPNLSDPSEKYLAMKSVKIPFRKPAANVEKIKAYILKFIDNYIETLRENKEKLRYKNIVDYDYALS